MNRKEIPESDKDAILSCMSDTVLGGEGKEEVEMRKELTKAGQHLTAAAATYVDILDLYEKLKCGELTHFDKAIEGVKYPLRPTSCLLFPR